MAFWFKIDFQDGGYGCHLGFLICTILAIFDLQKVDNLYQVSFLIYKSLLYLLPSLESTGLSVQESKFKIDFQDAGHGGHLGLLIETGFSIFYLRRSYISYQVSNQLTFPLRRRNSKYIFKMAEMTAILDFLSKRGSPDIKFRVHCPFGSGKVQNTFSSWWPWSHLGFPFGTISVFFFYLQVTPILSIWFRVSWPFSSRE